MITKEQVLNALRGVIHPEIGRNLLELGMIKEVTAKNEKVTLILALPFMEIPIKDDLVRSVRETVASLGTGLEVEVGLTEMSQKERAAFMTMAEGGPMVGESTNKISHVVAVLSGKGGVGKSSVAALLAVALRQEGHEVGILDADITGPSIPKMFFSTPQRPNNSPLGILPVRSRLGIKVMSINLLLPQEDEAVIWRGPLISTAIKQFWGEVFWGKLDYLVVDLPPGTSDASLTVMQSIPLSGVVLVTTPQGLAGMVVRKAARMAQHLGAPILGLVENMSGVVCPNCGQHIEVFGPSQAFHTALRLNVPLLGKLPFDPEISKLCDAGRIEEYSADVFTPVAKELIVGMEGKAE